MPPPDHPTDAAPDDMSDYLQMFMDETEEQLEGLVDALLVLEEDANDENAINEAFRLIHSIKGSAGMMGLESIALLTHHLESRFELFRSRARILDNPTMNLVLRCIDFLRECIRRMRAGEELGPVVPLLEELEALDATEARAPSSAPADPAAGSDEDADATTGAWATQADHAALVVVEFEPDLPLADLKAKLISARLSKLGDVLATRPALEDLAPGASLPRLELLLTTEASVEEIHAEADADGVARVEVGEAQGASQAAAPVEPRPVEPPAPTTPPATEAAPAPEAATAAPAVPTSPPQNAPPPAAAPEPVRRQPIETMRVDVERLDNLMNLAGELVVNRARFVQISERVAPALRSRTIASRARDFSDSLRHTIAHLEQASNGSGEWLTHIEGLTAGLELMEAQTAVWESGRQSFTEIGEAIDQLTRVSDSLQRSVLGTRMVPVAPLFNRFKRVVRDLSSERGKQVHLEILGEKTELDKRMIDELGDPLVHLVRNSIDHGLESPEVREARGKPPGGTIKLEARHSGNSVFIAIHDDGGGIDVDGVRSKILEKGLLGADAISQLSDDRVLEFIWHPGFSTAREVTDISGRGVGMDAVRTRITELNGTIDVDTTPGEGTVFTIRLPLTLAIIHSLLIKIRGVAFSMPIEDVREIVAVSPDDVVSVRGRETIDVRGEFIPLIAIDDVFDWHDVAYGLHTEGAPEPRAEGALIHAVVIQSGGKTMGLRVEELLGSDDLVIKSLSQNFINIRGLSGASILGDGGVCLMLDVSSAMDRVLKSARRPTAGT
ncbi:MAG: chemotaxis protein CheA [Planctomycetota bacterium]|nr:chemotaxis protein CheA [Planctomycetota bacterium]